MVVKENKPEIHLLITKAEVKEIELLDHWEKDKPVRIRVRIRLMIGDKTLTSMDLDSYGDEKEPNYIRCTKEMEKIYERLVKLVQKEANLSLENIQLQLNEVQEAEVV